MVSFATVIFFIVRDTFFPSPGFFCCYGCRKVVETFELLNHQRLIRGLALIIYEHATSRIKWVTQSSSSDRHYFRWETTLREEIWKGAKSGVSTSRKLDADTNQLPVSEASQRRACSFGGNYRKLQCDTFCAFVDCGRQRSAMLHQLVPFI